jgi:hypothetical protein
MKLPYNIGLRPARFTATWEGVLGNTSSAKSGPTVHHNTNGMPGMVIVGNTAYYAGEYNEHRPGYSEFSFQLNNPGVKKQLLPGNERGTSATRKVCSDGTRVYWGGTDAWTQSPSFVFATLVGTDSQVLFSSGQSYKTSIGDTLKSIINRVDVQYSFVTGLAVQKTGNYLFVARQAQNTITVVQKLTGAVVRTLPVTGPLDLACDSAGNLYVTSGTTITKYAVNTDGTLGAVAFTLTGFAFPVGVAVSPDNSYVLVADGGSSQQLKAYNAVIGAPLWTFGQLGGYANGPDVTPDKFCFTNTKQIGDAGMPDRSFIAFQADGSFWLEDQGTCRTLHYSADRQLLGAMQNMGYFYSCFADQNTPTRVVANFLEFEVDYSKPLAPNNGSWKLVKNWFYGITAATFDQNACLYGVTTLSNGRVYAMGKNSPTRTTIVELPPTGNLRYTPTEFSQNEVLNPDGSLWKLSGNDLGTPAVWQRKALTGFDASHNPQWGTWQVVATSPPITPRDPLTYGGGLRFSQQTASGKVIAFSGERYADGSRSIGNHLGAIQAGGKTWAWQASPSTTLSYSGPFPTDGRFDLGNGVHEAGAWMQVSGNLILWGYRGEFWRGGQVNKWNLYDDTGRFLLQFGLTREEAYALGEAPPGMAGNNVSGTLVKVGADYYLYHCDESFHGGIHRWKISTATPS